MVDLTNIDPVSKLTAALPAVRALNFIVTTNCVPVTGAQPPQVPRAKRSEPVSPVGFSAAKLKAVESV